MFIWRPVLRGIATYSEVTSTMTLIDLIKLNALLDMQDFISEQENKKYDKVK